jgi:ATP-dependent RNA helicase DeaD
MLDHIRSGALDTSGVEEVALDEADRMLDMGFREDLEAILESLPKKRRSHLMSATFGTAVRRLADRFQDDPVHLQGTALGVANEDIEHSAHLIRASDRYAALVNTLLVAQDSRCLVFVERRTEAADIAEKLARDGFAALPFSGELAQAQRTRTLAAFRNGSVPILVSTDVAARGIDVPDIGMVIQLTMPSDADGYTHRSGRTGRAGRTGQSVLLVPASAEHRARRLLDGAGIKVDWRPVPGPEQIRKLSRKALRGDLHARLDATEGGPSEQQLEYAASLIEKHDPLKVIATLMEMAEPSVKREPMPVAALVPGAKPPRASVERGKSRDFAPFVINWGQKTGATTPRLLSHICRRGGIKAREVGAIRVGPSSSCFEVSKQIADRFERMVAKPDTRDPAVRISRDHRGPMPPQARAPKARPSGSVHAKSRFRNKKTKGAGAPARG